MPNLTLEQRIKDLEKEVYSLRLAFMYFVRDEDLTPDEQAYENWRDEVKNKLPNGKLRNALRYGRDKGWHAT